MIGLCLLMTSPGIPLLFQGQEFAFDGDFTFTPFPPGPDWSQVGSFSTSGQGGGGWEDEGSSHGLFQLTKELISLRKNLNGTVKGLTGPSESLSVHQVDTFFRIIAFHRWVEFGEVRDHTLIVAHLQDSSLAYRIGAPLPGEWHVRFNSNDKRYSSSFPGSGEAVYSTSDISRGGFRQSLPLHLKPYSFLVLSQEPLPPPTEPPTSAPIPTETPSGTSPPTSQAPSSAAPDLKIVQVVLRIENLRYEWYLASAQNSLLLHQMVQGAFEERLGLPKGQIRILSVRKGSVVVQMEVETEEPKETKEKVEELLQDPRSLASYMEEIPAEAREEAGEEVLVDPQGSQASLPSSFNLGAVVGGVLGTLVALGLLACLLGLLSLEEE